MPFSGNLWQQVLAALEVDLDPSIISTWFRNTQLFETTENKVIIACNDAYSRNIIQRRYENQITDIVKKVSKKNMKLEFIVKPSSSATPITGPLFDDKTPDPVDTPAPDVTDFIDDPELAAEFDKPSNGFDISAPESTPTAALPTAPMQSNLNKTHTLDNFVVGVSNRVVHAATVTVVENPGSIYNPLFIYGTTGVGKTHLLHAIGNEIQAKHPEYNILYAPTERFVNDLIDHIRKKKDVSLFRKRYRQSNVLLIDDVQFLSGKEAMQEEFYHTFNELQQTGKQIVMVSDREPDEMEGIADRLISRFKGGLMVKIEAPDYETRLAIVKTKAEEFQLDLPEGVFDYIAQLNHKSVREIQGILLQIKSVALTTQTPISANLVKSIIEPKAQPEPQKRITPELILDLVTKEFDTNMKELCGKRRKKEIVTPRQVTMFLLRNELGMNFEDIGGLLGGRDHTTIMHGCDKIKNTLEDNKDPILRTTVHSIRKELYV